MAGGSDRPGGRAQVRRGGETAEQHREQQSRDTGEGKLSFPLKFFCQVRGGLKKKNPGLTTHI